MIVYDYTGREPRKGQAPPRGVVREWRDGLQSAERARLDLQLTLLRNAGPEMLPGLVAGPIKVKGNKYPGIYKIQINGRVALRPLLCRGPINMDQELTLLIGATERDREFVPSNAPKVAVKRRGELLDNAKLRSEYRFPDEEPSCPVS